MSVSNLASKMFKFPLLTSRHNISQNQADAISETSSSSPSLADLTDDEIFDDYMTKMRKRVNSHRRRVQKLREKHSGSCSEDFKSTAPPPPSDQERPQKIKDLQELTRSCVQETLELVVSCNKNREEQCHVEPAEYEELVDFCYDLSLEISSRLYTEERVSKWMKTKLFFKSLMKPFRKVLKRAQSSMIA